MNKPKIALGWIRPDMVDGAFQDSVDAFFDFDSRNHQICIGRGFEKALYLDDKRNELVRAFLKSPAGYMLSIDTDIEFVPEQVYQLVDEAVNQDRQILSGLYFSFLDPEKPWPLPVWFSEIDDNDCLKTYNSFVPGQVVVPLAAVGMGFCLIRRDVFEKFLTVPEYANDDWTWFGRDRYKWRGLPKHHGEDVCFCARAGKLGIQTWGHKAIQVGHWKKTKIDFHIFKAMIEYAKSIGIKV